MDLKSTISEAFSTYAAMTIQQRAIIDARDGLKPSARVCFYAQKLEKIDSKHPIQPSPTSTGAAIKYFYTHGDGSCYSLLARYGKEYVMRYPLEDFHGSTGSLISSGSEAASRYTKMRLNALGDKLFDSLEKDTIDKWFDNFANTKQYPSVLPSLGFYNIVNGTTGIATGLAASIPSFNLREVNEAMIKLLWNPDISFDEIYCRPDFISGATILNEKEVKESLRLGQGKSCCIRGAIEYDEEENCLIATEIPYGVFTNTICEEIQTLVNEDPLCGIEKVLDLTKMTPHIEIYLKKGININKIIKKLYKLTSLQSYFGINMVMLDKGTVPKVFSWKEALNAHLDHEKEVRIKAYQYDLVKIEKRLHIIKGILMAIANIDEVVSIIRGSNDKTTAANNLMERFGFSEQQCEAILKMTLSRLINLEIQSFVDEQNKLLTEDERIKNILSDKNLLYKEIEEDLREVADKYGDPRRTKCINLDFTSDEDDAEPIERKELLIHYTNLGNIYTQESSTLVTTRRGGKGSKIKLLANEAIIKTLSDDNFSSLLVFSNKGKMYHLSIDELPVNGKINISQLFDFEPNEHPTTLTSIARKNEVKYFIFITKNGMIKKTVASEYNIRRGKSVKAINLKDSDEVVNVLFLNSERVGILTYSNNFVIIDTESINPIGRTTAGVRAIKLSGDDYVLCGRAVKSTDKMLITLSESGLAKKTSLDEFPTCNRDIKGKKISGVKENDRIVDFLTINKNCDIIITTKQKSIKISTNELRELSRTAIGVKAIDGNGATNIIQDN